VVRLIGDVVLGKLGDDDSVTSVACVASVASCLGGLRDGGDVVLLVVGDGVDRVVLTDPGPLVTGSRSGLGGRRLRQGGGRCRRSDRLAVPILSRYPWGCG